MAEEPKKSHIGVKSGRTWQLGTANVIDAKTETHIVLLDHLATDSEIVDLPGVPKYGQEHATIKGLFVNGLRVTEGGDSDKYVLSVEVSYSSQSTSMSEKNKVPRGQDIQSWGWHSGSTTRDISDLRPNSAGQPFDSAPQREVATPTFTKVFKTVDRILARAYANKINESEMTIGAEKFPPWTIRCVQVEEDKLWADEFGWKWQYTISLQYMSNVVSCGYVGSEDEQSDKEIGWNVAITDAGCYEIDDQTGKLKRIAYPDAETGKVVYATTPQLLDGKGHAQEAGGSPFNFLVMCYDTTTFPESFVSDTPTYREEEPPPEAAP